MAKDPFALYVAHAPFPRAALNLVSPHSAHKRLHNPFVSFQNKDYL